MNPVASLQITRNRYAILACGTIVLMVLGLIYAWSIFVAPLEGEFGWTRSQTSLTFSVSMVAWSFGMLANGWLSRRLHLRVCFAIGGVLIGGGFLLTSATMTLPQLYVCYGLLCGFGTGLCYNLWTASTFAHFPDRAGFASGVLLMGFGMGAMILGSAAAALIHSGIGWRGAFIVLAIVVAVVVVLAMPFLHKPDEDAARSHGTSGPDGLELTGSQMVREPSFWVFVIWRVFVMGAAAAIIAQAAPMMADIGAGVVFTTMAVGALSIGNGCGRPLVGIVYDRIGRDRTMVVLPACGIVIGLALVAAYLLGSIPGLAIALFLEGVLYGGYSTIGNSFLRTTYGQGSIAMNIGISSLTLMPLNFLFPLGLGALFVATGGYAAGLMVLPALAFVSLVAGMVCGPAIRKMADRHAKRD